MAWGERMRLQDGKKIPAVLIVEDEPLVRLGAVKIIKDWPAAGSADTELGVLVEPEVCHGATEVYTRVQA
jgi:hypothetical protein